ncbi:ABC-three component system middle component 6 [Neorhodopirellula lusitana]|uniref:ABC-three component system middle component 6 n=1 Tax=Neorhodopirellula lusitana TaxID=445327 RepID=UPI00384B849A
MLLPDKHIRISESILGLAGLVYDSLVTPKSLDGLIDNLESRLESDQWPAEHSTQAVTLSLCFLHSINLVDVDSRGDFFRCD